MEGTYLHNLIFRALFVDSDRNILHYVVLGWGLPVAVVVPWVIVRIQLEDNYCWTTSGNVSPLIIKIPTMISILVSYFNLNLERVNRRLIVVDKLSVIYKDISGNVYETAISRQQRARAEIQKMGKINFGFSTAIWNPLFSF